MDDTYLVLGIIFSTLIFLSLFVIAFCLLKLRRAFNNRTREIKHEIHRNRDMVDVHFNEMGKQEESGHCQHQGPPGWMDAQQNNTALSDEEITEINPPQTNPQTETKPSTKVTNAMVYDGQQKNSPKELKVNLSESERVNLMDFPPAPSVIESPKVVEVDIHHPESINQHASPAVPAPLVEKSPTKPLVDTVTERTTTTLESSEFSESSDISYTGGGSFSRTTSGTSTITSTATTPKLPETPKATHPLKSKSAMKE